MHVDSIDYRAIGAFGTFHLIFFGIAIPFAVFRSRKKFDDDAQYPPRKQHFRSSLIQQVLFCALSICVARFEWIDVFAPYEPKAGDVALGAVVLASFIFAMARQWKRNVDRRVKKVELFSPRDGIERTLWLAIALMAGIGEEITYRGVMYTLLLRWTGSVDIAAWLCAGAFALSHMTQGWKSAVVILVFALVFQGLVLTTGTLYVAMVVHFLCDATAGLVYGALCRKRDAATAEPSPT